MKKNSTDFAELVTSFLTDYLPFQRNFSRNTILSYRDTLKLFLRFVTEEKSISLKKFRMKDFTRETCNRISGMVQKHWCKQFCS